eukprot:g18522.t1
MNSYCDDCGANIGHGKKECPECGATLTALNKVSEGGQLTVVVEAQKMGHTHANDNSKIFAMVTPKTAFLKKQIYKIDGDGKSNNEFDSDKDDDDEYHEGGQRSRGASRDGERSRGTSRTDNGLGTVPEGSTDTGSSAATHKTTTSTEGQKSTKCS